MKNQEIAHFKFEDITSNGFISSILSNEEANLNQQQPYLNFVHVSSSPIKPKYSLFSPFNKRNSNESRLKFIPCAYIFYQVYFTKALFVLNNISITLKPSSKVSELDCLGDFSILAFTGSKWVVLEIMKTREICDGKNHVLNLSNQQYTAVRFVQTNKNDPGKNYLNILNFDIYGTRIPLDTFYKPPPNFLANSTGINGDIFKVLANPKQTMSSVNVTSDNDQVNWGSLLWPGQKIDIDKPSTLHFTFNGLISISKFNLKTVPVVSVKFVVYSDVHNVIATIDDLFGEFGSVVPDWVPFFNHFSLTFDRPCSINSIEASGVIYNSLCELPRMNATQQKAVIPYEEHPFHGIIYNKFTQPVPYHNVYNGKEIKICLEKEFILKKYGITFGFVPKGWYLFGEIRGRFFLLHRVNNSCINENNNESIAVNNYRDKIIDPYQNKIYNVLNKAYFKDFVLIIEPFPQQESMDENSLSKEFYIDFFGEVVSPPASIMIEGSTFSVPFDIDAANKNENPGIIKTLISNNADVFITTHPLEEEFVENHKQNYSIFSKHIPEEKYSLSLDPIDQKEYTYTFHSFKIEVTGIYRSINSHSSNNRRFTVLALNENGEWFSIVDQDGEDNCYYPIGNKIITGFCINNRTISLKDFDFYGNITFKVPNLLFPSSICAFPSFESEKRGIVDAIANYTNCDPSSSGLFQAVGQFNQVDNSETSFLRGMVSVFDEYQSSTSTLTFYFKCRIRLSSYLIRVPNRPAGERYRNPHKWILEASNDDINWALLHDVQQDNIFDSEKEFSIFNTSICSDFYTMFRIVKFNPCNYDFNQLILFSVEFFGLVAPMYSTPDFFWVPQIVPIVPVDICNGVLGCMKYFGDKEIDQTASEFQFPQFMLNLSGIAIIDYSSDLKITATTFENKRVEISLLDYCKNPLEIGKIIFFKILPVILGVVAIELSRKTEGIEFFGCLSNEQFKHRQIIPNKTFDIHFPLNYKTGIMRSLLDINSSNPIKLFQVQISKRLGLKDIPYSQIDDQESYIQFDFIDTQVTIDYVFICCDTLKSLEITGTNDLNEKWEPVLYFNQHYGNHTEKIFILKADFSNPYRYFRLKKDNSDRTIAGLDFFGKLQLIKPRLRNACPLYCFEKTHIHAGLDYSNGIMYALKDFPVEKTKKGNVYTFDFLEITLTLSLYSFFYEMKNWRIEGRIDLKDEWDKIDDKINYQGTDLSFPVRTTYAFNSIRITTDDDFDFDKIEFFGDLEPSCQNPVFKKPPIFNFYLNPLNGILNSKSIKYKRYDNPAYVVIDFLDNKVKLSKAFVFFNGLLTDFLLIEASEDYIVWNNICKKELANISKLSIDCNEIIQGKYKVIRFMVSMVGKFSDIEIFGETFEDEQDDEEESSSNDLLSLLEPTCIPYAKATINHHGIFSSITNFYCDSSFVVSTRNSQGNAGNPNLLFNNKTLDLVSFMDDNNVLSIELKYAKIKLSCYYINFSPYDILLTTPLTKWTLEGSNDGNIWILIHSVKDRSIQIKESVFHIKNTNNESYKFFRFIVPSPFILRKIDFFGDYIPCVESNIVMRNAIIGAQPINLAASPFSGLFFSMTKYSNIFENRIVKAIPSELSKAVDEHNTTNIEISSCSLYYAEFDFSGAELTINFYSIITSAQNLIVEVYTKKDETWVVISRQSMTNNNSFTTFPIHRCPEFTKIRFSDEEKNHSFTIQNIELFGKIVDITATKSCRFDLLNGILKMLVPNNSMVLSGDVSVQSSEYIGANPYLLFERAQISSNRCFAFKSRCEETTTEDNDNTNANQNWSFVTLIFRTKSIRIEKYVLILPIECYIDNYQIEGSENGEKWEIIGKSDQRVEKDIIFGTHCSKSNSQHYYHFIRISSNSTFIFENFEVFGDFKDDIIEKPLASPIKYSEDPIKEFAYLSNFPINEQKGFFGCTETKGAVKFDVHDPIQPASSPIWSVFGLPPRSPSLENSVLVLSAQRSVISIEFLSCYFLPTHVYFDFVEEADVSLSSSSHELFSCLISKQKVVEIAQDAPSYLLKFEIKSTKPVAIRRIEFFGKVFPRLDSKLPLLDEGHNIIELSDLLFSGILKAICENSNNCLDNNGIVKVMERYPAISIPVFSKNHPYFEFGSSPQVTFNFGANRLTLHQFSISSSMINLIVEGSNDGESWFIIDTEYKMRKYASLIFSIKQNNHIHWPVSYIRFTNLDALFEPTEEIHSLHEIEFFGDLELVISDENKSLLKTEEESDEQITKILKYYTSNQALFFSTKVERCPSMPTAKPEPVYEEPLPIEEHESTIEWQDDEWDGDEQMASNDPSTMNISMILQLLNTMRDNTSPSSSSSSSSDISSSSW